MGLSESASMGGRDMIMPMVTLTLPIYRKRYKAMQKEAELLGQATLLIIRLLPIYCRTNISRQCRCITMPGEG